MAQGKGKIKGWITKNGQHIPIYDHYTAEPSPRLKNAKIKANRANAIDPMTVKTIKDVQEVVMGEHTDSYTDDKRYQEALDGASEVNTRENEIDEEMKRINEELKTEMHIPTKEEMPGFDRFERELFAEYTEKGEQLKDQEQKLREERNNLSKKREQYNRTMEMLDDQAYRRQIEDFRGTQIRPTEKTEFKGFQLDTATSYYEGLREKGEAFVAEMSPKEYLERCAYQVFDTTLERTLRAVNPKAVQKYSVEMNNGTNFYMPVLNLADKEQEGRHRAVTAIVNGIEKIPVLVVPKKRGY